MSVLRTRAFELHFCLCLCAVVWVDGAAGAPTVRTAAVRTLHFEDIGNQTAGAPCFVSPGRQYALRLAPGEATLAVPYRPAQTASDSRELQLATVRMEIQGANLAAPMRGVDRLGGTANYLLGTDRSGWLKGIPMYEKVRYEQVYPDIDLVFYGNDRTLEYDFVLAPGADPGRIQLVFHGAKGLRLDPAGNLAIRTEGRTIVQRAPSVYQASPAGRTAVPGEFVVANNRVGFRIGAYDRERELVIDPTIAFSTYLGGGVGALYGLPPDEHAEAVAVDAAGNAYVTGDTWSCYHGTMPGGTWPGGFPVTHGAVSYGWHPSTFITKFDSDGELLFSTLVGGNKHDWAFGIDVDSATNIYVAGLTSSPDLPVTNAYQSTINPGGIPLVDAFLLKLSGDGKNLLYGSYLGGSRIDEAKAIAVDNAGGAYITGYTRATNDFPTKNAYMTYGFRDCAFVAKFDTTQSGANSLVYSTYLSGSSDERAYGIDIDGSGNAYVAGKTRSSNFPLQNAYQGFPGGCMCAFVTKFNASGNALLYSTCLGGGSVSEARAIVADNAGNAYVTGHTICHDFPVQNAYQSTGRGSDAFVTRLDTTLSGAGSLVYSTFLGGNGVDEGYGISLDAGGNVYVTGSTRSSVGLPFPLKNFRPPTTTTGGWDAYAAMLNTGLSGEDSLVYSTFLGGSQDDFGNAIAATPAGSIYVVGETQSADFPTVAAYQDVHADTNSVDSFVLRITPHGTETALPVPGGSSGWSYPGTMLSVVRPQAQECKPLAIGNTAQGSVQLNLGLPPFQDNVDVHLLFYWGDTSDSTNGYVIRSNMTYRTLQQGFEPYVAATTGNFDTCLGELSLKFLPEGTNWFEVRVTPQGESGMQNYYQWRSSFVVPAAAEQAPEVQKTYAVTATAGANGSLSPTGNVEVAEGHTATFQIVADPLYEIGSILTNNQAAPITNPTNMWFHWQNVQSNGTLDVNFGAQQTSMGTPLPWLVQYGYTNDFETWDTSDTDVDGMKAWEEYVANTVPTNEDSSLSLKDIDPQPGDDAYVLTWSSASDTLYGVNWRASVTAEPNTIASNIPGQPPENVYTDSVHDTEPVGFYEIGVQRAE